MVATGKDAGVVVKVAGGDAISFASMGAAMKRAVALHDAIEPARRALMAAYVDLGKFLIGLREVVPSRQWQATLNAHGIHRKKADRAITLAMAELNGSLPEAIERARTNTGTFGTSASQSVREHRTPGVFAVLDELTPAGELPSMEELIAAMPEGCDDEDERGVAGTRGAETERPAPRVEAPAGDGARLQRTERKLGATLTQLSLAQAYEMADLARERARRLMQGGGDRGARAVALTQAYEHELAQLEEAA